MDLLWGQVELFPQQSETGFLTSFTFQQHVLLLVGMKTIIFAILVRKKFVFSENVSKILKNCAKCFFYKLLLTQFYTPLCFTVEENRTADQSHLPAVGRTNPGDALKDVFAQSKQNCFIRTILKV